MKAEVQQLQGELAELTKSQAVMANIARVDKMRNAKSYIPTELRRELQFSMQKYEPVHRNADDLFKGKDVAWRHPP